MKKYGVVGAIAIALSFVFGEKAFGQYIEPSKPDTLMNYELSVDVPTITTSQYTKALGAGGQEYHNGNVVKMSLQAGTSRTFLLKRQDQYRGEPQYFNAVVIETTDVQTEDPNCITKQLHFGDEAFETSRFGDKVVTIVPLDVAILSPEGRKIVNKFKRDYQLDPLHKTNEAAFEPQGRKFFNTEQKDYGKGTRGKASQPTSSGGGGQFYDRDYN